jgi:ABC-type multidrug transport system fused ATPase/permease subunit
VVAGGSIEGEIEFQDVWFRYPTRRNEWVLKGLSLKIKSHETVALVGESGCGKSTMVALLLRFYDVDSGRILLDGKDIRSYDLGVLRRALGLVMQEPTLFNYTIAENILYGSPHASNSQIAESAQAANALEFIAGEQSQGGFEDSGVSLYKEIKGRAAEVQAQIGQKQYEELLADLEAIKKQEEEKGEFMA